MSLSPRCVLLFAVLAVAMATPARAGGDLGIESVSAQHDAISAAMAKLDAEHQRQRADCYKRFLVNQCLDRVDHDYRAQHLSLQQQRDALDLAQRQQRAAEQLRSNAERQQQVKPIDPQQLQREQQQRADKQRELGERQRQLREQQPDAQTPEQRRQAYQQRQQRAASAAAAPPAPPLPLPPGR